MLDPVMIRDILYYQGEKLLIISINGMYISIIFIKNNRILTTNMYYFKCLGRYLFS